MAKLHNIPVRPGDKIYAGDKVGRVVEINEKQFVANFGNGYNVPINNSGRSPIYPEFGAIFFWGKAMVVSQDAIVAEAQHTISNAVRVCIAKMKKAGKV